MTVWSHDCMITWLYDHTTVWSHDSMITAPPSADSNLSANSTTCSVGTEILWEQRETENTSLVDCNIQLVVSMFIILSEQLIMVELSKTALDYRPLWFQHSSYCLPYTYLKSILSSISTSRHSQWYCTRPSLHWSWTSSPSGLLSHHLVVLTLLLLHWVL